MKLRHPLIPLIIMICLLCVGWGVPAEARARKPRAFFIIANIRQALEVSYEFNNEVAEGTRQTTTFIDHKLEESYQIGFDFALYDPKLAKGKARFRLEFDQETYTGNRQTPGNVMGSNLEYAMEMVFFEKSPYTVPLHANSSRSRVDRPYTGSFYAKNDSFGIGLFVRNKYVPFHTRYSLNTVDTTGLAINRIFTNENIYFSATNQLRNLSTTEMTFLRRTVSSEVRDHINYTDEVTTTEAVIRNTLVWQKDVLQRVLSTRLARQSERGSRSTDTTQGAVSLTWDLGRALRGGADYSLNDLKGSDRNRKESSATARLQHSLFKSLQENIDLFSRTTTVDEGEEKEQGWGAAIQYNKLLPAQSSINVGVDHHFSKTVRDFTASDIFVVQQIQMPRNFDEIFFYERRLDYVGIDWVNGRPTLRKASQAPDDPTPFPYIEGIDYIFDEFNNSILFFWGSIQPNENIVVEYRVHVDPSVTFSRSVTNVQSSLSLFKERFRIYGSVERNINKVLAGNKESALDDDILAYRGGVHVIYPLWRLHGEFFSYDSDNYGYNGFEVGAKYQKVSGSTSLTAQLRERVTFWSQKNPVLFTRTGGGDRTDNILTGLVQYRRILYNRVNMLVKADYIGRSGQQTNNTYSLGVTLQTRLGKLVAEVAASMGWYTSPTISRRQDEFRLKLTRYF